MQAWKKRILEIDDMFVTSSELSALTKKNRSAIEEYLHSLGLRHRQIKAHRHPWIDMVWDSLAIKAAVNKTSR